MIYESHFFATIKRYTIFFTATLAIFTLWYFFLIFLVYYLEYAVAHYYIIASSECRHDERFHYMIAFFWICLLRSRMRFIASFSDTMTLYTLPQSIFGHGSHAFTLSSPLLELSRRHEILTMVFTEVIYDYTFGFSLAFQSFSRRAAYIAFIFTHTLHFSAFFILPRWLLLSHFFMVYFSLNTAVVTIIEFRFFFFFSLNVCY